MDPFEAMRATLSWPSATALQKALQGLAMIGESLERRMQGKILQQVLLGPRSLAMRRTLLLSLFRPPLTERAPAPGDAALAELAGKVNAAARGRLGRSLAIREVDAGSCNGCDVEINALSNAFYDLDRFGLRFVASPRHADVLLVTGPVTRNMREALLRTWQATPDPKWVVAVRRLRPRRRPVCRQLRGDRRGSRGRAGRPAHPRLSAPAREAARGSAHPARDRRADARAG